MRFAKVRSTFGALLLDIHRLRATRDGSVASGDEDRWLKDEIAATGRVLRRGFSDSRLAGCSTYLGPPLNAARSQFGCPTYGTRTYYGHPVCLATRAAGNAFRHLYYRKTTRWMARPPRPRPLPATPANYDLHILGLRSRLHYTQEQLAKAIGAASKAVIYQWESRRRKPSAALWRRVEELRATAAPST